MSTLPALFVDLYELTMAQVYAERAMDAEAVFELTVRRLPDGWDYLVAGGLDRALSYLETLRFDEMDLRYLGSFPQFDAAFIDRLRQFRFNADVWAPPEGTIVYPHEPLIQVAGPLIDGQLVETALINQIAFATLIASKAARVVDAAAGRPVIEFGGRRAHGSEAAIEASRAAYLAGFDATSSVETGRRYGIPVTGTMGHSYILAEADELAAFNAFASRYPATTLLVDTYDTQSGVQHAIQVIERQGAGSVGAIRIDSGDLIEESRAARAQLDAADLHDVRIIASGGLDDYQIADLVAADAPIDVFACGTAVVAPADASTLDAAYKLVEYDGRAVAKRSPGKPSLGHRKQVWRSEERDLIARHDDPPAEAAEALLLPMMASGQRTAQARDSLKQIRARASSGRRSRSIVMASSLLD